MFGKHHFFIDTKFHLYANLFKVQVVSGLILLDYLDFLKKLRKVYRKTPVLELVLIKKLFQELSMQDWLRLALSSC